MDSKLLVKATPKPLLLKDYLLDDLSSCSSSGFPTFPRRQCCTTVRFLLEIDMKNKQTVYKKKPPKLIKNQASSPSSTTVSAFQKASEAVINAVKHFGFTMVKSTTSSSSQKKMKIAILPRSLSRKLLKKGFWKRNYHKEIERWKPSMEDKSETFNCSEMMKKDTIIVDSNSFTSESNSKKSESWSDSDYAISSSDDSSGKIMRKENVVSGKRVGATVGDDCDSMDATTSTNSSSTNSTNSKKSWTNEGKEQFSPVSVLDCPFDHDEDEVSSPFQNRLSRVEGTKKKLMKKLLKFERLAQFEPLNLEKRLALSESDRESIQCAQLHSSESSLESFMLNTEEEEDHAVEKPWKLLELIKATMPSYSSKVKADTLLLDFFKERITDGYEQSKGNELLSTAIDWIDGQYREFSVEWEVQKNRQAFMKDMEKRGEWKTFDEENIEMALELETEIFASLLNELMDDLFPSLVIV